MIDYMYAFHLFLYRFVRSDRKERFNVQVSSVEWEMNFTRPCIPCCIFCWINHFPPDWRKLYGSVQSNGTFRIVNIVDSLLYFVEPTMSHLTYSVTVHTVGLCRWTDPYNGRQEDLSVSQFITDRHNTDHITQVFLHLSSISICTHRWIYIDLR